MTRTAKKLAAPTTDDDDRVFDDAAALTALAQKSFSRAAKREVAKNDARGIDTHGSIKGKQVVRKARPKYHSP
jgi:hypothetical protein